MGDSMGLQNISESRITSSDPQQFIISNIQDQENAVSTKKICPDALKQLKQSEDSLRNQKLKYKFTLNRLEDHISAVLQNSRRRRSAECPLNNSHKFMQEEFKVDQRNNFANVEQVVPSITEWSLQGSELCRCAVEINKRLIRLMDPGFNKHQRQQEPLF